MEGIVIWIVIIIGWAILRGFFSNSGGGVSDEQRRELFDKIKLQLKVSEEIPPKNKGLPQ